MPSRRHSHPLSRKQRDASRGRSALGRSQRARYVLLAVLCLGVLASSSASASPAPLGWSPVTTVDFSADPSLGSLYCGSAASCDALDAAGRLVQFNPQRFEPDPEAGDLDDVDVSLDAPAPVVAMSCGGSQCTVIDREGSESTFSLRRLYGTFDYRRVDRSVSLTSQARPTGVDCPSSGRCVMTDSAGGMVSFSPADPAGARRTVVDRDGPGGLVAVTCSSAARCTAIGQTEEWTFSPDDPAAATSSTIDSATGALTALTCPSTAQCTAVDTVGRESTFDPQTPATIVPISVAATPGRGLSAVTCATDAVCTAADQDGSLDSFDPQTGAVLSRSAAEDVDDLLCVSSSLCLADQGTGGMTAFTPGVGSGSSNARGDSENSGNSGGAENLNESNGPALGPALSSVSCPVADRCDATDSTDQVEFDPHPGWTGGGAFRLPGTGAVGAIECALSTACDAVRGNTEVPFDPDHPDRPGRPRVVDPVASAALAALRCPRSSECVAVDSAGRATTYDPGDGHIIHDDIQLAAGKALTALSCPTVSDCTATDVAGAAISFDPLSGRRLGSVEIDAASAADDASVSWARELDGLVCRGATLCVAVDRLGNVVRFDPRSAHGVVARRIDAVAGLTAISCPTDAFCAAAGADGRIFTGTPGASRWTAARPFQSVAFTGVDCTSTTECVATDAAGQETTSRAVRQRRPSTVS